MTTLTMASRGSALALWQARYVAARLQQAEPGLTVRIDVIKTTGDKILDVPLAKVGGKGLFVKEIEEALQEGRADLAVHSMKDVPAVLPAGLEIAAVPEREDPRDAWVSRDGTPWLRLPPGARVGTSSLRRQSQLRMRRPDLLIEALRGNIDTRLRKLDAGLYDGIVLAVAGLRRLGLEARITEALPEAVMLPAIAQGALGIEIRSDRDHVRQLARRALHDPATATCVAAERAFLRRLGGGCQVPIAGRAQLEGAGLRLDGLVAWPDGSGGFEGTRRGSAAEAEDVGRALAEDLLARGADRIIAALGAGA